ncbi:3'(2'),5'-bisphosphate nucleotidase CysQ [Coralliovum pocilloporae]|uniref:3'(2'),5'-bisphosphate nucleotidase CysQ n=1 Tax=Coralliovum pocilloporae TaxID=3066369 RepID=UPI0033078DC5
MQDDKDLATLSELAREAGRIALGYFKNKPDVWTKGNDSPVSEADLAVDTFLKERCLEFRPDYGWLSEETADNPDRLGHKRIFVVDPIDGTRVFLKGGDEWTVSLAVVEDGRPTLAVLYNPVRDEMLCAAHGKGASLNGQALEAQSRTDFAENSISGPKIHMGHGAFDTLRPAVGRNIGSLAYRMALVATGNLSAASARPRAHDWDLAAADLIVCEAGAHITDLDGQLIRYNRPEPRHPALVAAAPGLYEPFLKRVVQAEADRTH